MAPRAVLIAAAPCLAQAAFSQEQANPIRKVVNMLQMMQAKVTEEGKKQTEAYNKFMCYCKTSGGDLSASIATAKERIDALTASIKSDTERKDMTDANLKEHTASRDDAKDTMAKSTAIRKKEAAAFAKVKSDLETNIAALDKAIPAIEKGMSGAFLQTTSASTVRRYFMERAEMPDATREEVLAFLSGGDGQGYSPASGEIVGILKTQHDEMSKSLAEATADENNAIQTYEALMAAKKKEVVSLQAQIEKEMTRIGDLSVKIAGEENDLEDTKESLTEDEKFKLELATSCETKTAEWEVIKETRAQEMVALSDTIKVLNDDDALELFKKTLPSASMSLVQVEQSRVSVRSKALSMVSKAKVAGKASQYNQPQLDVIFLALNGKKVGFEKVVAMIDEMMVNLKKEQQEDDQKKEYCNSMLDKMEDKSKSEKNSIADSETAIAEMKGSIQELTEEIAALTSGVQKLDKSVAEATDIRKEENADYKELMSNDGTAKEVLLFAKNRLNKFYNPKMYKVPPKVELSREERIVQNMGGKAAPTPPPGGIANTGIGAALVQIRSHRDAPPPPPATFGAYQNKGQQGNGVIAMIDLLIADLDKEMTEADANEKNAQANYETMMSEAAAKRAIDSKSITDKSAEKASTEESLQNEEDVKHDTQRDLMGTEKFISSLHGECDWLLKYFDVRKQARSDEVDSLNNAKAVLSGADYSLLQRGQSKHLRG